MAKKEVNLVLFRPNTPRFQILDSYLEVMESLQWGFQSLGYECALRINAISGDRNCINIVFGWIPALQMGNTFPEGTILYNLEQYSKTPMKGQALLEKIVEKYQIWDYSLANIRRWNEINPRFQPYYARVSFAPNLVKLPPVAAEDIDLLYVGSLGLNRAEKLIECSSSPNRNSVVTLSNVWGRQRDEFIARAKVLLNISNENPHMTIFEIVRVSYYLANKKAVICELFPGMEIEEEMLKVLKFAPASGLPAACDELVHDTEKRQKYAEECYETFRKRDVRDVIRNFFG